LPVYVTTGALESCFTVSETAPEDRTGSIVVVTEHERVTTPSSTAPSAQPVFAKGCPPKPCHVTETSPVYQPFFPVGLTGFSCAQTNPVPLRPGPVIAGLFVVFRPPAGNAVSNHCGKNWSSRALHEALGTGSQLRKTASS
jgi:hypothetical protein